MTLHKNKKYICYAKTLLQNILILANLSTISLGNAVALDRAIKYDCLHYNGAQFGFGVGICAGIEYSTFTSKLTYNDSQNNPVECDDKLFLFEILEGVNVTLFYKLPQRPLQININIQAMVPLLSQTSARCKNPLKLHEHSGSTFMMRNGINLMYYLYKTDIIDYKIIFGCSLSNNLMKHKSYHYGVDYICWITSLMPNIGVSSSYCNWGLEFTISPILRVKNSAIELQNEVPAETDRKDKTIKNSIPFNVQIQHSNFGIGCELSISYNLTVNVDDDTVDQ